MKTDNELIAEFMGAEFVRKPHVFYPDQYTETYIFNGHPGNWRVEKEIKSHLTAPMLCYHTDWDWLMQVIDKISKLHKERFHYDPIELANGVWPKDDEYLDVMTLPVSCPIQDVYQSVVEFIKWYNSQKP